jgi:hypothetical protein
MLQIFKIGVCCPSVFENRALRKIYGRQREEVTGGWRKM